MKYFIDTEFLEGTQEKRVLGFKVGQTKPTIDLISIGFVGNDNREYYAISKEFNLREAWNRWEQRTGEGDRNNREPRLYWLRENVLKPIFDELYQIEVTMYKRAISLSIPMAYPQNSKFTYRNLKKLIKNYGKTNAQIAEEVKEFVYSPYSMPFGKNNLLFERLSSNPISFYGYYADYDWVVFCWLFGTMMNLPKGFPMYCNDLKQTLETQGFGCNGTTIPLELWGKDIKEHPNYPKQTNEHNALADARWNKELYEFLKSL